MARSDAFYISGSFQRLTDVLTSPIFARLFLGSFTEGPHLWYRLASLNCTLVGDPVKWDWEPIDSNPTTPGTRFKSNGIDYLTGLGYEKSVVLPVSDVGSHDMRAYRVNSRRMVLRNDYIVRTKIKTLDHASESIEMEWGFRLGVAEGSGRFREAGDWGHVTFRAKRSGLVLLVTLEYVTLWRPPDSGPQVILDELCHIDDIVAHRGRLKADQEKIRLEIIQREKEHEEAVRLAAEKLRRLNEEAERQRQIAAAERKEKERQEAELARIRSEQQRDAQRRFAELAETEKRGLSLRRRTLSDEDIRRLTGDLCLACGHKIKMRRNNRFGHLFFGCSQWSWIEEECLCSGARPATCNICRNEMHEESNRPGVNVLRCENHPDCPGERSIPENLEISKWLSTRKPPKPEIRAHFIALGLLRDPSRPEQ